MQETATNRIQAEIRNASASIVLADQTSKVHAGTIDAGPVLARRFTRRFAVYLQHAPQGAPALP